MLPVLQDVRDLLLPASSVRPRDRHAGRLHGRHAPVSVRLNASLLLQPCAAKCIDFCKRFSTHLCTREAGTFWHSVLCIENAAAF
jgi:hypothetical protein